MADIIVTCIVWGFLILIAISLFAIAVSPWNASDDRWASLFFLCVLGFFVYRANTNDTTSRSYSYSSGSRGSSYSGKSRSFQGGGNSGIKSGSYSGGSSSGGNILAGDTGGPGFAVQGSNYGDSIYSYTSGYFPLGEKLYCFDNSIYNHQECFGYYESSPRHAHVYWNVGFKSCDIRYFYRNKQVDTMLR